LRDERQHLVSDRAFFESEVRAARETADDLRARGEDAEAADLDQYVDEVIDWVERRRALKVRADE
jgi:hypothetical protein